MDTYEEYERKCQKIRKKNELLLDEFAKWLGEKGLAKKTIDKHLYNVDFYINDFLLYEEANEAKTGYTDVGFFLGFWFIKKAMWSSKAAIKENAASLKKFYSFMFEKGEIDEEALDFLMNEIKTEMPAWLATMDRYDDPSIEDPEEIWFDD